MIFYPGDYRSELIFRHRSQYDLKTPFDSVFEAGVHKQRNTVQHLSALTRTESNYLASESFPWLWGVSKWLVESLPINTWEHLMSLSRSFLQMKAENQNFPQLTRIWLENWHLRSRINLWCKYKFTNMVLSLCWQMSKFTVWHFCFAYFDQHLPLHPSIKERRKRSCTPNIFVQYNIFSTNFVYFRFYYQVYK